MATSEQLAGKTISDPSEDRLLKIRKVVHNSPQRRRASPEKAERLRKRYEKAGYDPRGTHVEVEVVYLSQPKRGGGVTWISPVRLLRKLQSGEWSVEE